MTTTAATLDGAVRPTALTRLVEMAPAQRRNWAIAVETPVEINLNGEPFAVTMATPADVADLAVGYALSERLLLRADAFGSATVQDTVDGIIVNLTVPDDAIDVRARGSRRLEGRSGCGLCGIDSLAALRARSSGASLAAGPAITDAAVLTALHALSAQQPLNAITHSVHAAAWCSSAGEVQLVREDVGRHNALDKVIGALARAGRLGENGFVALTSRISFELVYKAATAHAVCLAAISAPTSLALEVAARLDLPVCCLGPGGTLVRFP